MIKKKALSLQKLVTTKTEIIMKKLFLILLLTLSFSTLFAQNVLREEVLLEDTTGNALWLGQVHFAGYWYTVTEAGIFLYHNDIVTVPAANHVLGGQTASIFIHKDSIPTIFLQMKNFGLNTLKPILQDSVDVMVIDWESILAGDAPDQ